MTLVHIVHTMFEVNPIVWAYLQLRSAINARLICTDPDSVSSHCSKATKKGRACELPSIPLEPVDLQNYLHKGNYDGIRRPQNLASDVRQHCLKLIE